LDLHQETLTEVQQLLQGSPICREIHSMSPLHPLNNQEATFSTIPERIAAWSMSDGKRIKSDIVCKKEGVEGISVGNPLEIYRLAQLLEDHGVSVGISERYQVDNR